MRRRSRCGRWELIVSGPAREREIDRYRDREEKLAIRVNAATREQTDVVRRWDQGTDIGQAGRQACLAINQRRPAVIYCSVSLFSRNKAHFSGIEKSRKARLRLSVNLRIDNVASLNLGRESVHFGRMV